MKNLKITGINYDVGTRYLSWFNTRDFLDYIIVERDFKVIKNELHCNSVTIYGEDISRLIETAKIALEVGLNVVIQPRLIDSNRSRLGAYITEISRQAEILRQQNQLVILNIGCEYSIFSSGIIPGINYSTRILSMILTFFLMKVYNKKLNDLLKYLVEKSRNEFKGKILYSSGFWEKVDWSIFDFVGINHYIDKYNEDSYERVIQDMTKYDKPIIVTEFGCCSFRGADLLGGSGFKVISWKKKPPRLKRKLIRDDSVQSNYISKLLDIFERNNIEGAFIFNYSDEKNTYSTDSIFDLDMASYGGIVRYDSTKNVLYKESFKAILNRFKSLS